MDPQVGASFIPKKPLVGESRRRSGMFGLVMFVSIMVFIISLVAAGATVLYVQYLKGALVSKSESLTRSQEAIGPAAIQDLIRLDDRINQSKALLSKHVAISAIFDFLSAQTLEKVQFTDFEYAAGEKGVATIRLSGVADSFSTIALQSDQFGASKTLKDVIFSNIVIAESGSVSFSVSAGVDPTLTLYSTKAVQGDTASSDTSNTQP